MRPGEPAEASGSGPTLDCNFASNPPARVKTGTNPFRTNWLAVTVTVNGDPLKEQFKSAIATFRYLNGSLTLRSPQCAVTDLRQNGVIDPSGEKFIQIRVPFDGTMMATPGPVGLRIVLKRSLEGNEEREFELCNVARLFEVADDGEIPPGRPDAFWTAFEARATYVAELPPAA